MGCFRPALLSRIIPNNQQFVNMIFVDYFTPYKRQKDTPATNAVHQGGNVAKKGKATEGG